MSYYATKIAFDSAAVVLFGTLGFLPGVLDFINRHATLSLSKKGVHIERVIFRIVCLSMLCWLAFDLWGALR